MIVATNQNEVEPAKYQLFDALRPDEYGALEADIRKRGVQVAVEVDENGDILDGHHRAEIAHRLGLDYPTTIRRFASEAEKREHVFKLNLVRRHLDPIQWGRAFGRLLAERGVETRRGPKDKDSNSDTVSEIAAGLGVNERTARRRLAAAKAYETLPVELQQSVATERTTLKQAMKKVARSFRDAARKKALLTHPIGGDIITGDLSLLETAIPDGSADLFFTDPPYTEKDIVGGIYERLSALAAAKLKPGGLCLVYTGQAFLPDAVDQLRTRLAYWWTFGIQFSEGRITIWNRAVQNCWRAVIVMGKPPLCPAVESVADFVRGGGSDKRFHEWGQDAAEATYWIEKLTAPGDLVVDPFCGGGAIPAACKATGRRWIATEIDPAIAAAARRRLESEASHV